MAQGGVTVAGLREAMAAVEQLDVTVVKKLAAVAKGTADRIAVNAALILNAKTHGTGKTAASIRVLDESEQKRYVVNVPGDPSRPENLPLWLERGTKYMVARAFLRPAGDAESQRYIAEMTSIAERAVKDALS